VGFRQSAVGVRPKNQLGNSKIKRRTRKTRAFGTRICTDQEELDRKNSFAKDLFVTIRVHPCNPCSSFAFGFGFLKARSTLKCFAATAKSKEEHGKHGPSAHGFARIRKN